jgi:hypothetical protein
VRAVRCFEWFRLLPLPRGLRFVVVRPKLKPRPSFFPVQQRGRSGQAAHIFCGKMACSPFLPDEIIGVVWPPGQVTWRSSKSIWKSAWLKPSGSFDCGVMVVRIGPVKSSVGGRS